MNVAVMMALDGWHGSDAKMGVTSLTASQAHFGREAAFGSRASSDNYSALWASPARWPSSQAVWASEAGHEAAAAYASNPGRST